MASTFAFANLTNRALKHHRSYGKHGFTIIEQGIHILFPESDKIWTNKGLLNAIAPLTPRAYRNFIVTYETLFMLVQEDLKCSETEAWEVLHHSALYGIQAFDNDTKHENQFTAESSRNVLCIRGRPEVSATLGL